MAVAAHLDLDRLGGRTDGEGVAAADAAHVRLVEGGMDLGLHWTYCSDASGGLELAGLDADALLGAGFVGEADLAVRRREERVVAPHPDVRARVERAATLPDDDRAGEDVLAVAALDAESLAGAVAPVTGGRASLLVCHRLLLGLGLLGDRLARSLRLLGCIGLGFGCLHRRLARALRLLRLGIGLGVGFGWRIRCLALRLLARCVDLVDPDANHVLAVAV